MPQEICFYDKEYSCLKVKNTNGDVIFSCQHGGKSTYIKPTEIARRTKIFHVDVLKECPTLRFDSDRFERITFSTNTDEPGGAVYHSIEKSEWNIDVSGFYNHDEKSVRYVEASVSIDAEAEKTTLPCMLVPFQSKNSIGQLQKITSSKKKWSFFGMNRRKKDEDGEPFILVIDGIEITLYHDEAICKPSNKLVLGRIALEQFSFTTMRKVTETGTEYSIIFPKTGGSASRAHVAIDQS